MSLSHHRLLATTMALLVAMAAHTARADLIIHLPLDATANDTVAPAQNGTLANGATINLVGPKIGAGAVLLDGTDDNVSMASFNFGNAFTLSAWVNLTNISTTTDDIQSVFGNTNGGFTTNGFRFFVNTFQTNNGTLNFETGNGSAGDGASTAAGAVPANGWHHVVAAVNRSTGTATLYVDGLAATTDSTIRNDFMNSNTFRIGTLNNATAGLRNRIDDAAVYNSILTATEVRSLYELGNNATLNYDASEVEQLLDLFAAGSGSTIVDGRQWFFRPDSLSGGLGVLQQMGSDFFLQLSPSGAGVATQAVPEPATVSLWLLAAAIVTAGAFFRRRSALAN